MKHFLWLVFKVFYEALGVAIEIAIMLWGLNLIF